MTPSKLRKLAALAARLAELQAIGWDEGAPFSTESMNDLITFMAEHQELALPSVVLTPAGHVRAQWRRGREEHFAIAFLGDNEVSYVIFAPDRENLGNTLTASGTATVDTIMQIAEPYGVLRWASAPIGEDNDA
jgi:hypothetical protein